MEYKVDKDVPIPVRTKAASLPLNELEVGESVLFPLEQRQQVQTAVSRLKKRTDKDFTVSKLNEQQARVWRVE